MVWRDCGWKTRLGTCFYDRLPEPERLGSLVERHPCILILGPRNAGKSELSRYTLYRRTGLHPAHIDARRGSVALEPPTAKKVAERIGRVLAEKAGLGSLFNAVVEGLIGIGMRPCRACGRVPPGWREPGSRAGIIV